MDMYKYSKMIYLLTPCICRIEPDTNIHFLDDHIEHTVFVQPPLTIVFYAFYEHFLFIIIIIIFNQPVL